MDSDGDGVFDGVDAFPDDPTESVDSDGDGFGDNADQFHRMRQNAAILIAMVTAIMRIASRMIHQNGWIPTLTVRVITPMCSRSTRLNSEIPTATGSGTMEMRFPMIQRESLDTDGDGLGNNSDNDDDNDGLIDSEDPYPLDENNFKDSDGDGLKTCQIGTMITMVC